MSEEFSSRRDIWFYVDAFGLKKKKRRKKRFHRFSLYQRDWSSPTMTTHTWSRRGVSQQWQPTWRLHYNPWMLGSSDLYSTFQYRESDPFFECVFLFPAFCCNVYRMHCVKRGHENARTNEKLQKRKKKKSPYQYLFTTYKMPLVIRCRFLGKGITTSVPTSVSVFTRMRGPNERVATALY